MPPNNKDTIKLRDVSEKRKEFFLLYYFKKFKFTLQKFKTNSLIK